jgi:hypothetical protein
MSELPKPVAWMNVGDATGQRYYTDDETWPSVIFTKHPLFTAEQVADLITEPQIEAAFRAAYCKAG